MAMLHNARSVRRSSPNLALLVEVNVSVSSIPLATTVRNVWKDSTLTQSHQILLVHVSQDSM